MILDHNHGLIDPKIYVARQNLRNWFKILSDEGFTIQDDEVTHKGVLYCKYNYTKKGIGFGAGP